MDRIPVKGPEDGDDEGKRGDDSVRFVGGRTNGSYSAGRRGGNGGAPGGNGGIRHDISLLSQSYLADEPIRTEDLFEFLEDNYRHVDAGQVGDIPTYTRGDGEDIPEKVTFSLDGSYEMLLQQETYVPPRAQLGVDDVDEVDTSNYRIDLILQGERGANPLQLGDIVDEFEDEYGAILEEFDREEEAARIQKAQLDAQTQPIMDMMEGEEEAEDFVEQHLVDVSDKSWDDIVLPEETEEKVKTMAVRPQNYPDVYERFERNPNAVLLYGKQGTGKTETGRIIASETDSPFLYMSVADFTNKFVGETSDRIKEVFKYVREEGAVLFLDEAEGLMGKRSASPSDGGGQVRNEMVQTLNRELSGMEDLDDGLVIAATNLEEGMDDAVIRDERFDHRIRVKPPQTPEERAEIFRIHTEGEAFGELDYDRLGEMTEKYTGANIKGTIDRAVDKQLQSSIREAEETQDAEEGGAEIQPEEIVVEQEDIEEVIEENKEDIIYQDEETDISEIGFGGG